MANENAMNQGPSIPSKEEQDLGSTAGAKADEYLARGKEVWSDAVRRVHTLQDDTEEYVRENPTKAVFAALAIGFVLGLMFRR
jgi:ElaB/YqjD/DUF883 family membrane-anchored ribosome-binding protein